MKLCTFLPKPHAISMLMNFVYKLAMNEFLGAIIGVHIIDVTMLDCGMRTKTLKNVFNWFSLGFIVHEVFFCMDLFYKLKFCRIFP